ncbi:MAG TPA: MerR family DNA-binding protein [Gammaproteobacteria bacterium]|nr:MerR family DNA-binding protein [Gammaproteobacteria bacterium]
MTDKAPGNEATDPRTRTTGRTIGQLAAAAGVNIQTVRYYQRRGLLEQPPRPPRGYRRYAPATLARLRFIRRAQGLGFTLREIGQLLDLADGRCADIRPLAQSKRNAIERRITDLERLRETLDNALADCERGDPEARCPLLSVLTGSDDQNQEP